MDAPIPKTSRDRQRLAWTILFISFTVCASITVATPFLVNAYLQNATDNLSVVVQANQGTVGIEDTSDVRKAIVVGETGQNIDPGSTVLTDATATAIMLVYPPENDQLLARLQVSGNTNVTLEEANTPHFEMSDAGQILRLDLEGGRLRLSIPDFEGLPFTIIVGTPQGSVEISQPGQYTLMADNEETQVTVQAGSARVSGQGQYIDLADDQRSIVRTNQAPSPPLGSERNLIENGDFSLGWDHWVQYVWEIERGDQPEGQIDVISESSEPVLHIAREGIGHAEVKVRQLINQDVNGSDSLHLRLTFLINWQSLAVCGEKGSECPLFVRINYIDQTGISRTWQHGFYAVGEASDNENPNTCSFCGVVQSSHDLVTMGQVKFYDLNLLDELARQGVPPASFIESVELVGSGHGFEVDIVEIALVVDE